MWRRYQKRANKSNKSIKFYNIDDCKAIKLTYLSIFQGWLLASLNFAIKVKNLKKKSCESNSVKQNVLKM